MVWREECDEIDDKAVDTARKAWRNWVDMNAFVHPGLMDCVAAYRCVTDTPNLTVKALTEFFTKHIGNQLTSNDQIKTPFFPTFREQGSLRRGRGLQPLGLQWRYPSPWTDPQHPGPDD